MGSHSRPGVPRADAVFLSSTKITYGTNQAVRGEPDGARLLDFGLEAVARLRNPGWRGEVTEVKSWKQRGRLTTRCLHVQPMCCRDFSCWPRPSVLTGSSPCPHCFNGGVYICLVKVAPLLPKQGSAGRLDGVHLSAFAQIGGVHQQSETAFPS